jgi:hypothetical protein
MDMKRIKSFKLFESSERTKIAQEIEDIFSTIQESGLEVSDVYSGNSLSMGAKDIVTDHRDFQTNIGPDGRWDASFKSLNVRLKSKNKALDGFTIQNNFYEDFDFYDELKDAIGHIESLYGLELRNLYLRTSNGVWFKDVDTMKKWIDELPLKQRSSLRYVLYLDITFEVTSDLLEEVRFSDIVKIKNSDSDAAINIHKMASKAKDFTGKLLRYVPLKSSKPGKPEMIAIDYNDTVEHDLRKRISERTNFTSTDEFNFFFREFLNEIFPYEVGKSLNKSGRYSLYSIEHDFSIIVYFNLERWTNGIKELNLITILPKRTGLDVVDIVDI